MPGDTPPAARPLPWPTRRRTLAACWQIPWFLIPDTPCCADALAHHSQPYASLGNILTLRPTYRLDMLQCQPYPEPRGLDGTAAEEASLAITLPFHDSRPLSHPLTNWSAYAP
jgi:hypothetical protein